jgi:hypothetical protein
MVDFDGVLHWYRKGYAGDANTYDEPVPGAVQFVTDLIQNGFEVTVFTTGAKSWEGELFIRKWLEKSGFPPKLAITDKKLAAVLYIDDRGWRFEGTFPDMATIAAAAHTWLEPVTEA